MGSCQITKINLDLIEIIQLRTFWIFYLNHLSPLQGYFSLFTYICVLGSMRINQSKFIAWCFFISYVSKNAENDNTIKTEK